MILLRPGPGGVTTPEATRLYIDATQSISQIRDRKEFRNSENKELDLVKVLNGMF